MSKKIIILGLLIAAAVIGAISWKIVYKKSAISVSKGANAIEISMETLLSDFEANENSADGKYLGKVIQIKGIINSMDKNDERVSIYLVIPGYLSGVNCSFDAQVIDASKLKPGQEVTVKGVCTGYLLDVIMNRCILVQKK